MFCLQCGTQLSAAETSVWNPTADKTADKTVSLGGDQQTVTGRSIETRFFQRTPTAQTPTKRNNNTTLLLSGGIAAVLLLILAAGAAVGGYYFYTRAPVAPNMPLPSPKNSVPNASPPPQASFTPPVEATKKGEITVFANNGWQLSDIDVVPLEEFTTSVAGLIDLTGLKTGVSSKGLTDAESRRTYPEFPTGALLMRTHYADGKYSNVQPVTAPPSKGDWQNFPDERGRLEFCVNDNAPEQNGGQFTVTVKMTSVPKEKK